MKLAIIGTQYVTFYQELETNDVIDAVRDTDVNDNMDYETPITADELREYLEYHFETENYCFGENKVTNIVDTNTNETVLIDVVGTEFR